MVLGWKMVLVWKIAHITPVPEISPMVIQQYVCRCAWTMMMMKLPILPCAEKLELVLSTAQEREITPTKTVKTENGQISRGSQSEMSMIRDLWGNDLPKR